MSEPRIPHDLHLGPHLLDDILRAFEGQGQWFIFNLRRLPVPLLATYLAHLHRAGIARPLCYEDGTLHYECDLFVTRENLRAPLHGSEVSGLLKRVCAKAQEMNAEVDAGYTVRQIYLYGSCLRGAESPRDIDLGLEIQREDGTLVPMPLAYTFGQPSEFTVASRPLALRKPKLISLHHIEEVRAIGAPHQLIWEAGRGARENEPLQSPVRTSNTCLTHEEKQQRHEVKQNALDTWVKQVREIQDWPIMPPVPFPAGPVASLAEYQSWQENRILQLRAHLHCLPDGPLRCLILDEAEAHWMNSAELQQSWPEVEPLILPFIHASQHYSPWQLRPDGTLTKGAASR